MESVTNTTGVKQLVEQHWDHRAAEFDLAPNHGIHSDAQREAWRAVLARLAGPAPLRVLDVGCGTGFLALLLAELGHTADGIDLAPEMLGLAQQKAAAAGLPVNFTRGDAEAPDAPDSTYDLIVERHVIWTLPNPEAALQAWLRLLRPGGRLALIEGQWGRGQDGRDEYQQMHDQLPLYGGRSSEQMRTFLSGADVRGITVEPLMAAVLWGSEPPHERYLIVGQRGE